ncbi:DUF6701 domain-containing protein [Vibrio marisflavi]|uniref:DUF6701 domain-containing protein n=1 Tax=Vibrio marisflavi CECT 7928 TaxID=634439 RepID=A0ABM9A7W7_9VIBR|nr:DUF6701 domain-containing protein [Vibrio marisflavi]CAH0541571.1 hypothetical protein VMF7928_03634 [Vibrio marisflavi CECT 7928]
MARIALILAIMLVGWQVRAEAVYPLGNAVCVSTAAQTWVGSGASVTLSTDDAILGLTDLKIGFDTSSEVANVTNSCGTGTCILDPDLRLDSSPTFTVPSLTYDATYSALTISGNSSMTLSNGTYRITDSLTLMGIAELNLVGDVTLYVESLNVTGTSTLNINGSVTIYLEQLTTSGNAAITTTSSDPDDFIIVSMEGTNSSNIQIRGANIDITAHLFAETDLEISQNATVTGTVTSKNLTISDSGTLVADVPETCNAVDFSTLNLCNYIPEPAQAWASSSSLSIQNSSSTISGWSQSYLSTNLSGSNLAVSFDTLSYQAGQAGACGDSYACTTGATKVSTPPSLAPTFSSTTSLSITASNYTSVCDGTNCSYSVSGSDVTINILTSLQTLSVTGYGANMIVSFTDLGEENGYGTLIESYTASGDVDSRFAANGNYTFGTMTMGGGGANRTSISTYAGVQIFVVTSYSESSGNAVQFNDLGGDNDLIMYGPDASYTFIESSHSDITAQLLASSITLSNSMDIVGGVTTNTFTTSEANTNIIGSGSCLNPATNSFDLTISPSTDTSLSCVAQTITLQVVDGDGAASGDYTGSIHVSADSGSLSVTTGSYVSGTSYQPDSNGTLVLALDGEGVGDITVTAYLEDDQSNTTVTGEYTFVSNKLEISTNPTEVIAGKSVQVTVQPLECQSVGGSEVAVVSTDYVGNITLSTTSTSYSQPSSPTNSASVYIKDDSDSSYTEVSNDVTLNFALNGSSEVEAQMDVLYSEAGSVSYSLSNQQCNDDGDCETYTGTHTIYARPWTLAICSSDTISGTSSSGSGYKASGESFAVMVKPIIWVSGGSETAAVETSSYCSITVTQNFFDSDAPSATVALTHDIDTPSGGNAGNLSGTTSMSNTNKSASGDYFDFSGLSWDEVGSIQLQADTSATYLGMDVNQGYRAVGRFYPAYFKVTDTTWSYPNSQSFIYMGQPFDGVEFKVEALNSSESAVQNYVSFDSSLQAGFDLLENSSYASRFVSPTFSAGIWALDSSSSIGTFTNTVASDCTDSICWNKATDYSADGPFNKSGSSDVSVISLDSQSSNTDPVAYTTSGDALTDQPDIRFGRINLTDVGGVQGDTLTVPLAVEYWDGSGFTTNTDDSGTSFDAANFCQQAIWSSETDNGSLSGSGTVSSGTSRSIKASQTTSAREQIKFWLTLVSGGESSSCEGTNNDLSWLQYDWSNTGSDEQDPHSIVTFGIYRGNDKVLFRGESGLTGQ